ncbi:hypothetical protein DPEC_G00196780 [Dallia pectoralis]|uniref:Uncharacterized protein n=1 Tax=Dallia pectoralis TaxID=75939 RepID=A0ACC2G7V1_DALPE|nr:hypothetical protein DPEC_G00196780 [Dallia pectoralis]
MRVPLARPSGGAIVTPVHRGFHKGPEERWEGPRERKKKRETLLTTAGESGAFRATLGDRARTVAWKMDGEGPPRWECVSGAPSPPRSHEHTRRGQRPRGLRLPLSLPTQTLTRLPYLCYSIPFLHK